ncbi:ClpP/crotonase-like domain-containing protein [Paraphysoderma sedebokerense]|nr:ClpP/crotonase-like domain-containing protein [Paraphysoderma sedebokerense]
MICYLDRFILSPISVQSISKLCNVTSTLIPRLHRKYSSAAKPTSSSYIHQIRQSLKSLGAGSIDLLYHRSLPIGLIQINNPTKHNALSGKMLAELAETVDTLQHYQNRLGFLIITGKGGKSFCAGLDLSVAKDHILTPQAGKEMSLLMHDTLSRIRHIPLVSFAAIEGYSLGGGAELSTVTDFRILSPKSYISFVQLKMSVVPGWGGGTRLSKLVGHQNALRLLLSCDKVGIEKGQEIGLVDWGANEGECVLKAVKIVQKWLNIEKVDESPYNENEDEAYSDKSKADSYIESNFTGSPSWLGREGGKFDLEAIRGMKSIVVSAVDKPFQESLENERAWFGKVWGAPANQEAVKRAGTKKVKKE